MKLVLATGLLLVALGAVVWVSVNTTRSATDGADIIDQEFSERISTDRAGA